MTQPTLLLPYLGRWNQFRRSRFHQIAERLAMEGWEIHVLQTPPVQSEEVLFREREIDVPDGIHLHEANLNSRLWHSDFANKVFQKGYYGLGVHSQVNTLIDRHDIDALWLYNLPHYTLAITADVPVVFDYVDDYIAMLNSELPIPGNTLLERTEEFFFSHILSNSDLVFSVSHELAETVSRLSPQTPCNVLPNGVDDRIFPVTESVDTPTLHEPPTVGFVGSFEYFIDFDLILKTANRLPEVEFLLVGDGREYESVETTVDEWGLDNVELTGLVESQEVPEYIAQMDICLNTFERVPVAHSAVPLKLFEYLSMARPVVSTELREVQTIDEGWLYYANEPDELAATIRAIVDDYDAAVRKTFPGKETVRQVYNWDVIADDFRTTLREQNLV